MQRMQQKETHIDTQIDTRAINMDTNETIQYTVRTGTVSARCTNPRQRCMLYSFFAPLPNLRVIGEKKSKSAFECTVFLRNKSTYDVNKGKQQILEIMKQVCPKCQQGRTK